MAVLFRVAVLPALGVVATQPGTVALTAPEPHAAGSVIDLDVGVTSAVTVSAFPVA
jgi:hypothetical protein